MLALCGCGRMASEMMFPGAWRLFSTYSNRYLYTNKLSRLSATRNITSSRFKSSVIYANHYQEGNIALVEVDLDLRSRFKDIRTLHENVTLRGMETTNVYHLASKFKTLNLVEEKKQELEAEREEIATHMSHIVKGQKTAALEALKSNLISRGKEIREDLKEVNRYYYNLEEDVILSGLQLPVDLHPSTPIECDQVIRTRGSVCAKLTHNALSHLSIGKRSGTIYKKPVGPQRYYLRGKTAKLEQDLTYKLSQKFRRKGFIQMSPPDAVKTIVVEGSGLDIDDPQEVYVLQNKPTDAISDDIASNHTLHLTGVSPLAFHAFITKMNFAESSLPLKWCATGRQYNPSENVEDKGLFACPQSSVIELFGLAKDDSQASSLYGDFIEETWDAIESLRTDLPIRMVAKWPEDLKLYEAGRVDIEAWSSGSQQYVQIGYIATCSDFVGRRLMAKWSPRPETVVPGNFLHTVHGTGLNLFALIGVLMEHYQTHVHGTGLNVFALIGVLMEHYQTHSGHTMVPDDLLLQ